MLRLGRGEKVLRLSDDGWCMRNGSLFCVFVCYASPIERKSITSCAEWRTIFHFILKNDEACVVAQKLRSRHFLQS